MSKFTYTSSAVPKNNLRLRIKKLSQSRVDQMQQYMFYAQYMYGEYIKIRHIYIKYKCSRLMSWQAWFFVRKSRLFLGQFCGHADQSLAISRVQQIRLTNEVTQPKSTGEIFLTKNRMSNGISLRFQRNKNLKILSVI